MRSLFVVTAVLLFASPSSAQPKRDGWVLIHGDSQSVSGSSSDVNRALATRKGHEDLLWFRRGNQAFVVRDPHVIARAKALFAPLDVPSAKMEGLGRVQEALGRRMEKLGARMATAVNDPDRMERLGAHMEALGAQMERLGKEQELLGKEMERIAKNAERRIDDLIDEAWRTGKATPAG
jgi:hypothetical protein